MPSYVKGIQGCAGKADLYWFAPEALIIITDKAHHLYDPRVELPVSEALVRSIMRRGILQAVRITPGEPMVVAGRQRVRAALEANQRGQTPPVRVPCVVLAGATDQLAGAGVAENEIRQDDNPAVKAEKAQRLQSLGYSVGDIADDFGVTEVTVRGWLKLAAAPPEVRQAVREKKVSARAAKKLAALPAPEAAAAVEAGATNERQVAAATGQRMPLGKREVRAICRDRNEHIRVANLAADDRQMSVGDLAWDWYCAGLRRAAGLPEED